jgi:hypothetical protein
MQNMDPTRQDGPRYRKANAVRMSPTMGGFLDEADRQKVLTLFEALYKDGVGYAINFHSEATGGPIYQN